MLSEFVQKSCTQSAKYKEKNTKTENENSFGGTANIKQSKFGKFRTENKKRENVYYTIFAHQRTEITDTR